MKKPLILYSKISWHAIQTFKTFTSTCSLLFKFQGLWWGWGLSFCRAKKTLQLCWSHWTQARCFLFLSFSELFFSLQVNMAKSSGYLYANIIFTVITIVINSWAGKIILGKERTRIHDLIVFDCFVNILSSLNTAFYQSPWFVLR